MSLKIDTRSQVQPINGFFGSDKQKDFVELHKISEKPMFGGMVKDTDKSTDEVVQYVSSLIKQHLKETIYDRLKEVNCFLNFLEEKNGLEQSSLKSLADFTPEIDLCSRDKTLPLGSSCVGLTINLLKKISPEFRPTIIGATLPNKLRQSGFPEKAHVAIVIATKTDYVLLDPNFDIADPIVIYRDGTKKIVHMKNNKGDWSFKYRNQ